MTKHLLAFAILASPSALAAAQPLGVFTSHGDVGTPSTIGAGRAVYDEHSRTYTVAGGGETIPDSHYLAFVSSQIVPE